MPELFDLTGKHILLTGASRGLGRAVAQACWARGAHLFLFARARDALEALRAELLAAAQPGQAVHIADGDLALPASVPALMRQVTQTWTRVDVLINNAAIVGAIGRAWENDWATWEMTLRVNLLAPVELCRACVPLMLSAGEGSMINLSGGGATSPRPNFSAYATAKTALVRFSETLASELRGTDIRVNCVAPGAMNTAMLQAVLDAGADRAGDEYARALAQAQHGGTLPARAAELIAFLASTSSRGITGKLISAGWDRWETLPVHLADLQDSDIYTLRRIIPRERGKDWE